MIPDEWQLIGLVQLIACIYAGILILLFNLVLIHVQYVVLCVSIVIRVVRQVLIHLILLLSFINDQLRYLESVHFVFIDIMYLQDIQV